MIIVIKLINLKEHERKEKRKEQQPKAHIKKGDNIP